MAKGANKSAKQNNGYITIDSTGSFVSANARGNYFVLKGIIGKQAIAEEIKKIINNDKVTTKDIFKQLKNPKFNKLIMTDTKKINTKIFCSVPVFRLLMEKNMIMDFLFLYDDGDIVGSFTIDNNDCIKNNVQAKAIK
jgi:hypothetical protein